MKQIVGQAKWGLWTGLFILGIAEAVRPGFLGLGSITGGLACLGILVAFAIAGSLVGGLLGLKKGPGRREAHRISRSAWTLVLLLPVLGWGLHAVRQLDAEPEGPRVMLLGVDGATWQTIDPLIEAGLLPNFAQLRQEGASGVLRSESPPLSPRVWTTIATGMGPEQHGAVDFLTTQGAIRVPRVWEIVEGLGGTVGIWEWLVTWPPGQHSGFLVPGWLKRGPETWPSNLEFYQQIRGEGVDGTGLGSLVTAGLRGYLNGLRLETLLKAASYKVRLSLMSRQDRRASPLRTFLHADMAADLFLHWYRRTAPQLGALVLYSVDSLAHRFWIDFEPEEFGLDRASRGTKYSRVIPQGYQQVDRILGRVLRQVDDGVLVMVISDHGTRANTAAFSHYSIRSDNLIEALDMTGRLGAFTVGRLLQLRELDPAESGGTPRFVEMLSEATVDGAPLFDLEESTTGVYSLRIAGKPPLEATVAIAGKETELSRLARTSKISGEHTLDGIVALTGPAVQPGAKIAGATLRDITPTALTYLNYPVSSIMDGTVLTDAFGPDAGRSVQPRVVDSYDFGWRQIEDPSDEEEADEEVLKRLRALGYIQ